MYVYYGANVHIYHIYLNIYTIVHFIVTSTFHQVLQVFKFRGNKGFALCRSFCARAEVFAPALLAMPFVLIMQLLLLLSGDVETNPGPLGQHTEGRRLLSFRHVDAMYSLLNCECRHDHMCD